MVYTRKIEVKIIWIKYDKCSREELLSFSNVNASLDLTWPFKMMNVLSCSRVESASAFEIRKISSSRWRQQLYRFPFKYDERIFSIRSEFCVFHRWGYKFIKMLTVHFPFAVVRPWIGTWSIHDIWFWGYLNLRQKFMKSDQHILP